MRGLAILAMLALVASVGCRDNEHPSQDAAGERAASPPVGTPAAWQPYSLGTHHRSVTTKIAAAQQAFDQGLVWSFAFNHDEAIRAFEEALRLDSQLAMAAWGIALVNGPHINNPAMDEAHSKAAWAALQRAQKLAPGASAVERALIDALSQRYAWPPPTDRAPLDLAYASAMADVRRRFPEDADVATLYAESLMDTRPWDQWTKEGEPQPGTLEVLAALEAALQLAPQHPGALHLWIHALEASPQPQRAAPAAEALRSLVPDASHLVHMPSHIDVRLGNWERAATANEKAIEADKRYRGRQPQIGFYAVYMAHNTHFLAYTAMMEGRREVALARAAEVVGGITPEAVRENPLFLDAFMTVELEAMKRFGRWNDILARPLPPADWPVSMAHAHFIRGTALAATDRVPEAEEEKRRFQTALAAIPEGAYWGSNSARAVLAVGVPYLDGEISYRKGDLTTAARQLAEAVRLEDALKYDEPPPWTTPSRHALGAVLLAAGRKQEAEAVYREDLRRYPKNGWSLWGLSQALARTTRDAEAAAARTEFLQAWARADTPIGSSCLCVKPAAGS